MALQTWPLKSSGRDSGLQIFAKGGLAGVETGLTLTAKHANEGELPSRAGMDFCNRCTEEGRPWIRHRTFPVHDGAADSRAFQPL